MSTSMELEVELTALKDELSKLQSDLQEARQDEENAEEAHREYFRRSVRTEYSLMVDALSLPVPPRTKIPFPTLLTPGAATAGAELVEVPLAPDAFVFMSLMQLCVDDDVGLGVLAERLQYVRDLSMTNVEELVLLIPKIGNSVASETRTALIQALAERVVRGVSGGQWEPSASVYGAIGSVLSRKVNQQLEQSASMDLLVSLMAQSSLSSISKWPTHHVASIAFFLSQHAASNSAASNFLLCLSGWLQANIFADELYNVQTLALVLGALRQASVAVSANLASQMTITADRALNSSMKTPAFSTDIHMLAVELAAIKARGTGSLWLNLIDRLVHGATAMFEVAGTVEAVVSMGYTHDAIYTNLQQLKRYVTQPAPSEVFNSQLLAQILLNLCEMGERSVAVLRLLYERKDLIEQDVHCYWHFLAATAVVSAQGTSVSEGILLFKKQDQFSADVLCSGKRLLVNLALAPNFIAPALVQSAASQALEQFCTEAQQKQLERVRSLVGLLGYAEPDTVQFNYVCDGVLVDVAFPKEKIAFVIEPEPLYNVSLKRYILRGWTNLRTSVLSRKNWKVHTWIADTYLDDKSALAFLAECVKRVPINLNIALASPDDAKNLKPGQKVKTLQVLGLGQVEVAKLLLSILRGNVTVDFLDLSNLRLTDYMSEVIAEFLMTYISKYPLSRIDLSHNLLTDAFLHRVLFALKTLQSTATRQLEVFVYGNKVTSHIPPAEATNPIKVVLGPNPGSVAETPGITVFVVGAAAEGAL